MSSLSPEQRAALDEAFGRSTGPVADADAASALPAAGGGPKLTRRAWLAATGGGLVIAATGLGPRAVRAAEPGLPEAAGAAPFQPNAFIRVGTDNLVTIVCKHHEMGQGSTTGLATLAADELDADWSLVRTEYAPANPKLYNNLVFGSLQGTGGSSAMADAFLQMRSAGATARAMLVAAAAQAWQVPASEVKAERNLLSHPSGRRASYGEMAEAAGRLPVPANAPLKTPDRFVYIGKEQATQRVDSRAKCDGTAVYTIDFQLPGLLTAVIAWPPSFGATLVSFDASEALKVPGVTDVVRVPEGVAVVAKGTWAALQGRRALKVTWDESANATLDTEALRLQYRVQSTQTGTPFVQAQPPQGGAAETGTQSGGPERKAGGEHQLDALYEFPFLAHAPMEPMNCVAWLHDGLLETWSGHQFASFDLMFAAQAAGLPEDKVRLHALVSGGSFGRRANSWSDFTVAAVHVAKAINGRAPVRLQYTREDDMSAGLYRPMYAHAAQVTLDRKARRVTGWKHTIVGQSIMADTVMAATIKNGIDNSSVEGISPSIYELPAMSGSLHSPKLPVRPLWWRSVGHTHTAYVMETLMDELAQAAGTDPVAFRLGLLGKNERAAAVLKLAAEKAGWGRPLPKGRALGIAVHESFKSFVAQVAEVSLQGGQVRVERVVCAVDCGQVVNPDVVRAQMEGGIGFALGAFYYGEIEVREGRAVQRNFDTYRALRIHEMPKVEVHIVPSTASPTGVGEPGVPPLAPAVANAIAKLTGERIRRLPMVKSGLKVA